MNLESVIARVDQIIAQQGKLPDAVTLTRYRSFADWHLPSEDGPAVEADYETARDNTDALAAELTRRGCKVMGVGFDRAAYDDWRVNKPDTRNRRAEWASEQVVQKSRYVWSFVIGKTEIHEAVRAEISIAFKVSHDAIGWAVLQHPANPDNAAS